MVINIDLDSWEVGYADGQFGRLSQCPANLDSFSYSSGYCEGRACRGGRPQRSCSRAHPDSPWIMVQENGALEPSRALDLEGRARNDSGESTGAIWPLQATPRRRDSKRLHGHF